MMHRICDLSGRTVLLTGTGGLGLKVAVELAGRGAKVIVAGRNRRKGDAALRVIATEAHASAEFETVDLASLGSVHALADRLTSRMSALDILINNAGVMFPPAGSRTHDGFDLQFGVNYLAHFVLTARLIPLLRASGRGRVVNVSSQAYRGGKGAYDTLFNRGVLPATEGYAESKLAQCLFTRQLQHYSETRGWGMDAIACHPGMSNTNLLANQLGEDSILNKLSRRVIIPLFGQSASDGARSIVMAACDPSLIGGEMIGPSGFLKLKGPPKRQPFTRKANDMELARALWERSEEVAGTRFPIDDQP